MIIKGSARGATRADGIKLARHLLAEENEAVEVVATYGVEGRDLLVIVERLRLLVLGTRARQGLYHASINLDRTEASTLSRSQWLDAVEELGRGLGMDGHHFVAVQHVKHGRPHLHVVWSRVHPVTLRVARDSHNYRVHERVSRALERRLGLKPVGGTINRPKGKARPVAQATHRDWQASERTGIRVPDLAEKLKRMWARTDTAAAFHRAVEEEGWSLASGRRGIVLVDQAGTPHSLPRRLGLKAAAVHLRLAALSGLPSVESIKQRRRTTMPKKSAPRLGARHRPRDDRAPEKIYPPQADYWRQLGYEFQAFDDHLAVKLPSNATLFDFGDRLEIDRAGEPTDEDIRLLVTAARERGWKEIRFYGGSEEFQKRARLEALRQGYRLDQISLECEDGKPKPLAAVPMPNHIRNKLLPPVPETSPEPPPPESLVPTPKMELRP